MPSAQELAAEYRRVGKVFVDAVKGMTREQVLAKPVPGKWSTLEVVAHLADFEPVYVDRMKRIISHDKPLLMGADENLFLKTLFYADRDLAEELAVIDATRASFTRIIEKLSPEHLNRQGVHSERGLTTLEALIVLQNEHMLHHLKFIVEKKTALGIA
jgi:uncharacterized damage-inducible protein DinB